MRQGGGQEDPEITDLEGRKTGGQTGRKPRRAKRREQNAGHRSRKEGKTGAKGKETEE